MMLTEEYKIIKRFDPYREIKPLKSTIGIRGTIGNRNTFDTHRCIQPHIKSAPITLAIFVFLTTTELTEDTVVVVD